MDEKPPPTENNICQPITTGVCSCAGSWCTYWGKPLVDRRHCPSPMLASRLRNDSVVLDSFRQGD